MALKDLTRQSVLDALAEYERLGQAEFLARHGFQPARSLLLVHEGRRYDSKAIAGVAHAYATGQPLAAADFSGGAATVRPALEALGFQVVRAQNPDWERREVILACDLVFDNDWHELRTHDPRVRELSELLRGMDIHPAADRADNFRSPDAVSRKTTDLMTAHPAYIGARTKGGRVDREVIQDFIADPVRMKAEAVALRAAAATGARRQGVASGLTAGDIDAALHEWRLLGRDDFMERFGGRAAERYVVAAHDVDADALALILGARALAGLDTHGPWRGDRSNVAEPLTRLGYVVRDLQAPQQPEIGAAVAAVEDAAGRTTTTAQRRGQGFNLDTAAKLAIERHAMALARAHYEALGAVEDTSTRKSWDFEVEIDDVSWHIEVKGTAGEGREVLLTPNEVAHAMTYPHVALFIVSGIEVHRDDAGGARTSGGRAEVIHPWSLNRDCLRPIGFTYSLC